MQRNKSEKENMIKSRKNLYILGFTYMLCLSSYQGILGLESSMNVEDGMGTLSVMAIFVISSVSCIIIVPNLIDFWGAKAAIIIGEIGMAIYVAANFFPNWFTLLAAAIIHGMIESAPWAGTSVYVAFLGEQKWKKQGNRNESGVVPQKTFVFRYFGKFNVFIYAGVLLGTGLLSLILRVFETFENEKIFTSNSTFPVSLSSTTFATLNINASFVLTEISVDTNSIANCGAKDCQADYIYSGSEEKLNKYIPSQTSIYVFLSVFLTLSIIGIILQIVFLESAPAKFDKQEKNDKNLLRDEENAPKAVVLKKLFNQFQDLFLHFFSPQHLLIAPMFFYFGLYYGYCVIEYTRAYVSCTLGVEQLGFALMTCAVGGTVASLSGPKLIQQFGRKKFVIFLMIFHINLYLLELLWVPTKTNLWISYCIGALSGMGEGIITALLPGLFAVYFEKKKLGIAYSVGNLVTNLGMVAATGWSTLFCVYTKIYILIACLIAASAFLLGAEMLHARNFKNSTPIQ